MLKHAEEITCRCGLKQKVYASYVLCVSCDRPLLVPKQTNPKALIRLKDGVVVASRYLEKGAIVEDVIVYGKFNHQHSVDGHLISGFAPFYKRTDTPNVRILLFGGKGKIVATSPINRGEEIHIHVTGN